MNLKIIFNLILIVNLTNSATVYIINVPEDGDVTEKSKPQETKDDSLKAHEQLFLDTLIKYFGDIKHDMRPKHKCDRRFGSMYGTKEQKLKCLSRRERSTQPTNVIPSFRHTFKTRLRYPLFYLPRHLQIKPFDRQDNQFSLDYLDLTDLSRSLRSPEFSQDYLDVNDLRSGRLIPFDYVDLSVNLNLTFDSRVPEARRSGGANVRASIESSDTDIAKDTFKATPKRFKVVPSDSSDKSSKSDSSVDTKSNEKLNVEKKFATGNTDSEDNTKDENDSDNSNTETKETITSSKKVGTPKNNNGAKLTEKNRVVYMQSLNKVIEEDGRRRLTHFLPKRFHWKEEEFDNLGYFWFNGHRGKYAEPWRVDN